jgi:hypothetical protein
MAIGYLPNDPSAGQPPLRVVQPSANRKPSQIGFTFEPLPAEKEYPAGSEDFLRWQCREAALQTLQTWDQVGPPLKGWAGQASKKRLRVRFNAGDDLNAYYDRSTLSFFHSVVAAQHFYSGMSTDVVAHEVGHALLDAIRPDLWDSMFFESNAFHEAFGDCVAILVALSDRDTRVALLAVTANLSQPNFVEATAEDLATAVRKKIGPQHNAATPRRALNQFRWKFNDALPANGPGTMLINEIHSFGQVFSGCFYDLIRGIYQENGAGGEAALWEAAKAAGQLLMAGSAKAPDVPRFTQSVGRTMALEEEQLFGGRYRSVIRAAFAGHDVPLGGSAMLAPRASIGTAPALRITATTASLTGAARSELRRHVHADSAARMAMRALDIGGKRVAEATYQRSVDLTGSAEYLRGVVAKATEPVLLERAAGRAAILGAVPDNVATEGEVHKFVATLVRDGMIREPAPRGQKKGRKRRGRGVVGGDNTSPTHEIVRVGGVKVLRRMHYACACHSLARLAAR